MCAEINTVPDETNNAVANLVALTNSEHLRVHWRIRKGASPLEAMRVVMVTT